MRRTAVLCFSLIVIIGLMLTTGCNPFRITITPSTIEVTVGDPINFSVFKTSMSGDVPYNEAIWELMGDDVGSLTNSTGPTTRVNTDTAGNAQLKASSPDGKVYALASIYVTYVQIPTSVVIDQSNGWSIKHGDIKTFSAKLLDQFNKQITSATFTWAITNGTGSFSPNPGASTTFTAGDPGTSPDSASVTATYNGGQNPITSPACTGTISRQTAVLTTLTISPSDSFSLEKSKTKSFSASGLDQYGGAFTCNPTWSATNTIGTFSPNPSANTTFTAASSGSLPRSGVITAQQTNANGIPITSNSVNGTINDYVPIPTRVAIDQSSGWSIKHADNKSFSAKLYDQYDVQITSATFTWAITNGTGSFSPNPGASTTFTAGDPGTSPDSASVTATYNGGQNPITSPACTGTISRQTAVLTTLTISPPESFSIIKGTPKPFSAAGFDQYGIAFTCNPTWSASNNTGGFSPNPGASTTFTATTTGVPKSGVISAIQVNSLGATIQSNTVPVTVNDVERIPTRIAIVQSNGWSMIHGEQKTFNAVLYDQFDAEMPAVSYTWAISGGNGSFSPNPGSSTTFTAGDPGTSPDSASITAAYSTLTSPASTGTITRQASRPSRVVVSPSLAAVVGKETQDFTAVVYNQYDVVMNGEPVTWSLTGQDIGTLSSSSSNPTTFRAVDFAYGNPDREGAIWAKATNNLSVGDDSKIYALPSRTLNSVSIEPSAITATSKTSSMKATAYDQYGAPFAVDDWTWSTSSYGSLQFLNELTWSGDGTSTSNASLMIGEGISTATYVIKIATATKGSTSKSKTIRIDVPKSFVSSITISPSSASGDLNTSSSFTASAKDQYGYSISTTFSWSVSNSVGSLQYTSSSGSNKITYKKAVSGSITASSNGKTDSATVVGKPLYGTYDNSTWIDVSIPDGQYPNGWGVMRHTVNGVLPKAYIIWTYLEYGVRHKYFGDLTRWATRYYNGNWYDTPYLRLSGYLSTPEERTYSISTGQWNNQIANGEFNICVGDDDTDDYKLGYITFFRVVVDWRCDDIW